MLTWRGSGMQLSSLTFGVSTEDHATILYKFRAEGKSDLPSKRHDGSLWLVDGSKCEKRSVPSRLDRGFSRQRDSGLLRHDERDKRPAMRT